MKWSGGNPFLLLGASLLALIGTMDSVSAAPPIVADHTVVEKYRDIPTFWIGEVKKMWLNVPGESHSSGYRKGLDFLESIDPRFQVNRTEDNADPEPYTDQHLRVSGHRRDSGGYWSYGAGEGNWYTNAAGIENIKAHIAYSNTHNLAIAAIGFAWCWDTTWHNAPGGGIDPVYQVRWAGASEGGPQGDSRWGLDAGDQPLTGNSVSMDTYLSATQQYIDNAAASGYPTKVFFTTGPVDGYAGESAYQRHLKHQHIRNYVNSHDGILFDYADILQWGDDGTQETETWTDYGSVLRTFPKMHSNNMLDFGGGYAEDGDHIGERGALRLGKAMWWMLARVAGWDGLAGGVDNTAPTVSSTAPANGATNLDPATPVTATFSEPVDPSTVSTATFTLVDGNGTPVTGTVNLVGTVATLTPSSPLAGGATYAAAITTAVKDLAGNPITAPYSWSFATAPPSGGGGPAPGSSSSGGGGACSIARWSGAPGDFSGAYGALGYATLLLATWVRRRNKRAGSEQPPGQR